MQTKTKNPIKDPIVQLGLRTIDVFERTTGNYKKHSYIIQLVR